MGNQSDQSARSSIGTSDRHYFIGVRERERERSGNEKKNEEVFVLKKCIPKKDGGGGVFFFF